MPTQSYSLYSPILAIGAPVATITLTDADDNFFEVPDVLNNNQAATIGGSPVTVNSVLAALGPQVVIASVGGIEISVSLTPVQVVVEDGIIDDVYIVYPGLPEGAEIISVTVPLVFPTPTSLALCLAGETLVETPSGPRPAIEIEVGDEICTVDRGPLEVKWVGKRRFDFRRDPSLARHAPVVIEPGALGDGLPRRRLRLSPLHRVLVSHWRAELMFGEREVLSAAKYLVDGDRIWKDADCETVDYIHFLFDRHELIYAEGAPVESFHPGDTAATALDRETRQELLDIFPELNRDWDEFGPAARPSLKRFEGEALARAVFAA